MRTIAVCACLAALVCLNGRADTLRDSVSEDLSKADSLAQANNSAAAIELGRTLAAESDAAFGAEDTLTARIFYRLATYHLANRSGDSAELYGQRALAGFSGHGAKPSQLLAEITSFLGVVQKSRGNSSTAIQSFEKALRLYAALGIAEGADAARTMNKLAATYDDVGRLQESIRMHERTRPLLIRHFGEDDPSVATSLANLGQTYYKLGHTARAENTMREAIALMRRTLPPDSPRLAGFLGNLGYLLNLRRRYDQSAEVLREALAILARSSDPDPSAERAVSVQYADVCRNIGFPDSAAYYFQRAYDASLILGGRGSRHEASAAGNLAQAMEDVKRYDEADSLWSIAERIHEVANPVDSQSLLINTYRRLYYLNQRPNSDIGAGLERVMAITDAYYGATKHPVTAAAKELVAEVALNRGRVSTARKAAVDAFRIQFSLVSEDARYLNERDALDAALDMTGARDLTLSSLLADSSVVVIPDSLAIRLFAVKGMISEILAERQQVSALADSNRIDLRTAYHAVRREIAGRFAGSTDFQTREFARRMDSLQRTADSLEFLLAMDTGEDSAEVDRTLKNLSSELSTDQELLVDYLVIERPSQNIPGHRDRWLIASLWQSCGEVQCIALGPMAEIERRLENLRHHLLLLAAQPGLPSHEDEAHYRELAEAVADMVWNPIESHWCREPTSIRISPDGALCMLPFAALPTGENSYLIDQAAISYLTSLRQLPREHQPPTGNWLLAIGNPDFDLDPETEGETATLRSAADACRVDRLAPLTKLPLSGYEVETIAADWNQRGVAEVLLRGAATESAVRTKAPQARVIHIATHGYYLAPDCNRHTSDLIGSLDNQPVVHPLLLSGLFLAGANAEDNSVDPENDGVLSAYEILGLDLHRVEVAVLSACESGLGESIPGEGVAGLRRAFHLAGVNTVVCSLWPVPDRRTARFMIRLYNRTEDDMSTRLIYEQRNSLGELRDSDLSTHPVSWAAFIAVK